MNFHLLFKLQLQIIIKLKFILWRCKSNKFKKLLAGQLKNIIKINKEIQIKNYKIIFKA